MHAGVRILRMRPCTQELGFWVDVPAAKYQTVEGAERRRVLASGCGAVTTILGSLSAVPRRRTVPTPPDTARMRLLFKELFARGERYKETGDASIIWEGHKAGREIGYCHMEKLSNLDALPDHGFKVACFPVKIERASAGWTRAVAIIEE